MKGKLLAGFVAVVGAQLLLLLGMVGFNEYALHSGTGVVLQTAPIDPRSLLQGDYVVLGYQVDTIPPAYPIGLAGSTVYVTLAEGSEVWKAVDYSTNRPPAGRVFIKGTVGRNCRLDFGIGNYFVPEGTGHDIERAMFSGDPLAVKVRVAVDRDGKAAIQGLLVNGKRFDPKAAEQPTPRPRDRPISPPPPEPATPETQPAPPRPLPTQRTC